MGVGPPAAVPGFFYVDSPTSAHGKADAPQIGVTFMGTRRDVLVDDVISVEGPRLPASADAPKTHRQGLIYIVTTRRRLGAGPAAERGRIRTMWHAFLPH